MVFQTNETHRLRVIRGTTKAIRVTIRDAAGNLYTPREGDIVRFGVKRSYDSTRYLIERESAEIVDSAVLFRLSPEDTAVLDLGQYRYDVGLQSGPDYLNVIPYSIFEIMPNVTGKKPGDAAGGIEDVAELAGTIETVPAQTGGAYVLPVATPETLGGVKPVAKTDAMTQSVGVDEEGRLFVEPGEDPDSGQNGNGLSTTAVNLLMDVLEAVQYHTNVSGKIEQLREALLSGSSGGGDTGGGEEPDEPVVNDDITVSNGVMTIVSVGSAITVSNGVMTIA